MPELLDNTTETEVLERNWIINHIERALETRRRAEKLHRELKGDDDREDVFLTLRYILVEGEEK